MHVKFTFRRETNGQTVSKLFIKDSLVLDRWHTSLRYMRRFSGLEERCIDDTVDCPLDHDRTAFATLDFGCRTNRFALVAEGYFQWSCRRRDMDDFRFSYDTGNLQGSSRRGMC